MAATLRPADPGRDRDVLVRLNIDYMNWIAAGVQERFGLALAEILGMQVSDYVTGSVDKLCTAVPPEGIFYLAEDGSPPLGMGGLRRSSNGVTEIKRLYVSPDARGRGVGTCILARLIADARAFGNRELFLDSGPFMNSAHRLYEAAGFVDIPPYPEAEPPEALRHAWRFMKLRLA